MGLCGSALEQTGEGRGLREMVQGAGPPLDHGLKRLGAHAPHPDQGGGGSTLEGGAATPRLCLSTRDPTRRDLEEEGIS